MKQKLLKYLKVLSIFLCGIVVGVIVMGYLSVRASKTYIDIFRSLYYAEQEKLAADAHAKGNKYAELRYRQNIVDSHSYGGTLTVFSSMSKTWSFDFPFVAPVLDRLYNGSPNKERGQIIGYATELGRLAETMENIGLKNEAVNLWAESARLMGHNDITRMRKFVAGLHEIDDKYILSEGKEK